MGNRDFSIFDRTAGDIVKGIDDADRDAVKRRLNLELDRYESEAHSVVHQMSIATRKRIRDIERKALARLGERVVQLSQQGRQYSLCAQYESDVRLVALGDTHAVCAECIVLVKQIVDEDKDGQRSNK
jgi:hypothetical protein